MLINFKVENHRSIKKEVEFSFVASNDDTFNDKLIKTKDFNLLRSSVIYGANGSGKSNVLNALYFMKKLVLNSNKSDKAIKQQVHLTSSEVENSVFLVNFIKIDTRYTYSFTLNNGKVIEEYLYYYPKAKKVEIFTRIDSKVLINKDFSKEFEILTKNQKDNILYLSLCENVNITKEAYSFFKNDLVFFEECSNDLFKLISANLQTKKIKKEFCKILTSLDTGIKDIEIGTNNVLLVYKDFKINLKEESTGTKKLFKVLLTIIDVLQNSKILIVDEFETALHESIILEILKLFKLNSNASQLLFTTHNTNLMRTDIFRKDQIWFAELDKSRSTDLYSLIEIKELAKNENIKHGYIKGKYGAMPILEDINEVLNGKKHE